MIKVSVIVPVYNVENYLVKCLDSLVNQTLKEIEIIVVNDGSPDNSQKIIDKYVKQYPQKIKSFIKENGGLGSARNYGLKYAKGEYIAFIDSDDFADLKMLEEMYNLAQKDKSDIVICGNNLLDENYNILKVESAILNPKINNDLIKYKFAVWNKLYKKELLFNNKIQFRSKVWYEDVDFTTKVMIIAKDISFIDKPLYNYLLRKGSIMNNSNLERNLEIFYSFDEIINFCKTNKIYKKYYSEIEYLCIYNIYICGIVRIIRTDNSMKDKKLIIKKFKEYLYKNFKDFKKNKYIKYMSKNKKIIYYLLNCRLYLIIKLMFYIREVVKNEGNAIY